MPTSSPARRVLAVRGTTAKPEDWAPYEEALRAAGLEPVILSPAETAGLNGFGGLLLIGGSDIDPARYHAPPDPRTSAPDTQTG